MANYNYKSLRGQLWPTIGFSCFRASSHYAS
jgi:hypothetical protein